MTTPKREFPKHAVCVCRLSSVDIVVRRAYRRRSTARYIFRSRYSVFRIIWLLLIIIFAIYHRIFCEAKDMPTSSAFSHVSFPCARLLLSPSEIFVAARRKLCYKLSLCAFKCHSAVAAVVIRARNFRQTHVIFNYRCAFAQKPAKQRQITLMGIQNNESEKYKRYFSATMRMCSCCCQCLFVCRWNGIKFYVIAIKFFPVSLTFSECERNSCGDLNPNLEFSHRHVCCHCCC